MRVELNSHIILKGLTQTECEIIEQDLVFKNPQYEKVKKYSKWNTTNVPEYLQYFKFYEELGEVCAKVPIGYSRFNFTKSEIKDSRVYPKITYPQFLMELRQTQEEALTQYINFNCIDKYYSRGSIQLPTGKGKTVLGIALASKLQTRTLIIVHKTDLVKSWREDIATAFGGKADVGLIKAQTRKVGEHFTIATIQTLNKLSQKELKSLYNYFGLVIQDEMHHCPSSSFELGNNFNSRFRLGLTATPERSDGLSCVMNLFYGDFCFTYGHRKDDDDILQVSVLKKTISTYFNPVVTKVGDKYKIKKELDSPINFDLSNARLKDNEKRISDLSYSARPKIAHFNIDYLTISHPNTVVQVTNDIFNEFTKGHSCIAFFTQKEEIVLYRDYLISIGIDEACIGLYYGDNKDCDSVIDRAEKQRGFITLATYSKATEGTNVKQWEVGFLVSSINNGKNVEQAVGRIRRKLDNGKKLKVAKLYDYRYENVYQLNRHGITRDKRYKLLKFDFDKPIQWALNFTRGYNS